MKGAGVPVICEYVDFFLGTSSSDPCVRLPCHLSTVILLSKVLQGGLFWFKGKRRRREFPLCLPR